MTAQDAHARAAYVPALRFRWLTPLYDSLVAATTREATFRRRLLAQAQLDRGMRVLDLGCGTGTLLCAAARAVPGAALFGIDGDPHVLRLAQRKAARGGARVVWCRGFATQLPYADNSFDRVLASLFLHHLNRADKLRTLREVGRVLKPGGALHVADWGRAGNLAQRALFVPVQLLDGFANTCDHVAGRLPALFTEAGLQQVSEVERLATMFGSLCLYRAACVSD